MKKTRVISLALVAMLFFSLTAFTPAAKAVKAGSSLSTPITFQAKKACDHNYITTQYGKWELYSSHKSFTGVSTYKYRRKVTLVCTKCADVLTYTEYKTVTKIFGIVANEQTK
ncbi:MAG: hypothetical protein IJL60_03635 [Clostridiales bacterium]|nr:hypothetical protein [Clostridiales bacterium]